MKQNTQRSGRLELYVRQDVGTGDPIVLLHGLFGSGTQWEKIVAQLQGRFRVITVDLLGHGRSPHGADLDFSPDEQAGALRASLERLGATDHLTVVGYSMGGAVALRYAAKYRAGVKQLYLISTPFYLTPDQMTDIHYAGAVLVTKLSALVFRSVERLLRTSKLTQRLVHSADKSQAFHKMIGATDNPLDPHAIELSIGKLVREFDFVGNLQQLTMPATFYAGKKDPFIVQGQVYSLRKFCQYIDIERLDVIKVDHMLVQNLPKEIAGLISSNAADTLHIHADAGAGRPLVLLHGIESSADYWDALVPVIAAERRVVTVDLLGFGKSPRPLNVAYSLADQVQWLERTLQAIGLTEFDLAGHSLGGLVSMAYAAKYPEQVKSLTLIAPVLVPDEEAPGNFILQQLRHFTAISDTSYIYSRVSRAIGEKRLKRLTPSVRSVENAVKRQESLRLAAAAAGTPTEIIYGRKDQLIDVPYLQKIARQFQAATVTELPESGHNFALFEPKLILSQFVGRDVSGLKLQAPSKIPPSFARQLMSLAAPVLWARGLLYLAIGLLLFTSYAPVILVVGLAVFVVMQGYKVIRGSFSLKNEGLAYFGYFLLGLAACVLGYVLVRHPQFSLKVTVIVICGLFLLTGLARLLVALAWTYNRVLRRNLLLTGSGMAFLGLAAFLGSLTSIYLIVYAIALYLMMRGVQIASYATVAFALAFVRGFNRR